MLQNLTGWHALIVLAIVLLIFGAAKLPALAKSVGQSVRILKTESTAADTAPAPAETAAAPADATVTPAPTPVATPPLERVAS